jgi:acyl-CoA thioesterase-1
MGTGFDIADGRNLLLHAVLFRLLLPAVLLFVACQPPPPEEAAPRQPGPARHSQPAAEDTRPSIVAFGDSLTAGYGVPAGESYPDHLQRKLDALGYRYRVVNEGVSGDTTAAGLTRLEAVIAAEPEIVIVEFGGNDGLRGLAVEQVEENLRRIASRLQEGGTKVVLAGMRLPPNYGREYVTAFEGVYPRLAKELNLTLIPFLLDGVAARPELLVDEIHPNEKGNEIVAGNVLEVLEPLLAHSSP